MSSPTPASSEPKERTPGEPTRNPFSGKSSSSSSHFDSLAKDAMQRWHVPGFAVAIIDDHDITCRGYGVARLNHESDPNDESSAPLPVTPQTLFDCASMSKSFTAAAVALLVEDEELKDVDWRTPVSKLCEDFVFEDDVKTASVSVEDILSHRTGLPDHDESIRSVRHKTPDTMASVTRNLRNLPFTRPLRTEYQYSNMLYTSAAYLVEKLSKTDFEDFLRDRFWKPLGMNRTFLGPDTVPSSEQPTVAQGYMWNHDKGKNAPMHHDPEPEGLGCGSIQSSVEDYARWIRAFIHRAPPLSESSYEQLATPRILASFDEDVPYLSPMFYALGWAISYYHSHTIIKHTGGWAGYTSCMLYIPSRKWGFVMMANSENAGNANAELAWHLIDEVLQVKSDQRFDWRSYFTKRDEKFFQPDSKEELYPELSDHKDHPAKEDPKLEHFAGTYANKGYHEIVLTYNSADQSLEVDCLDRSYQFLLAIKEHAYDLCYVAKSIDATTGEAFRTLRCKFEIDDEGKRKRVGLDFGGDVENLIWFERVA